MTLAPEPKIKYIQVVYTNVKMTVLLSDLEENMVSRIGAKEFRSRIKRKVQKINNSIKEDDLYFSQTLGGYYLSYQPNYPNSSRKDFIIAQDLAGSITVDGNQYSIFGHGLKSFNNIDEFELKM